MLSLKIKPKGGIGSMAISKNYIVVGGEGGDEIDIALSIRIWGRNTGRHIRTLKGHASRINSIATDGNLIVSASDDETVKIWNINTGECIKTIKHDSSVHSVAIVGDRIISGSYYGTIKIWDIGSGELIKTLRDHTGVVNNIAADGDNIVSGSFDGKIKIWNINTNDPINTINASPTCVAIKGNFIVYGDRDGIVRRLNITQKRPKILGRHTAQTVGGYGNSSRTYIPSVETVSIHKNFVISASDGGIRMYNLNTGRKLVQVDDKLTHRWDKKYNAAYIDDYGIVANNSRDRFIYTFDLAGELKYPFVQGLSDIEGIQYEMEETPDTLEVHIQVEDHPLLLKITVMADGTYKVAKEGGSDVLECIVGKALCKKISQHKFTNIVDMIIAIYNKFDEKKWNKCVNKIKGPRTNNLKF